MLKLPFWIWPYSWGMKGKARKIAEAEYNLQGYELEHELLCIKIDEYTEDEFLRKEAVIKLKYGKITEYEHKYALVRLIKDIHEREIAIAQLEFESNRITDTEYRRRMANLIRDEEQKSKMLLELDYKEHLIGEQEYNKRLATLNGEPWISVLNMDFNKAISLEGSFELDWNDLFIEKLEKEGYTGPSPDNIVNQWFMTLCRNIAMEEFDGTGDFTGDSQANLEAYKRWNTDQMISADGKRIHK